FPTMITMTKIQVGDFFRRIEVIAFAWIMLSNSIKLTLYLYASNDLLGRTFSKWPKWGTLGILGVCTLVYSFSLEGNIYEFFQSAHDQSFYTTQLTFALYIPLVLLLVYWIRRALKRFERPVSQ
ncbi:MAG: GerAB/ArcD/ProY family transporter, partial [Bacilli bacterium]